MPRTEGDDWFEQYLAAHGYQAGEHEPDLSEIGINTRPDFLPRRGAQQVACEVEGFGTNSKLARRMRQQRTLVASDAEVYGPIRRRIERAAKQLKPLLSLQLPLIVVLANPKGAPVDLSVDHVIAAMYGNPRWVIPINGATGGPADEGRLELGRDGKLTHDHPYVAAVVLLRRRELASDVAAEVGARVRSRFASPPATSEERIEQATVMLEEMNQRDIPKGHYFYVDVLETASETAMALPDDWFDGPRDSRWRPNSDGYFERVRGTDWQNT